MPKYFAYGSNCNPQIMEKKGVSFIARQRAVLRGYRLLFNKKSLRERLPGKIGFANVNECPDGQVEGILYEIAPESLPVLDASERYPDHYDRIQVVVEVESGSETCWVYKAQPDKIAEGLVPSRNYLNHILSGREFLSQQYFEALDQSQTYVAECVCCRRTREVLFVREGELLHTLCQPCREARLIWGDTLGRRLKIAETEAVMTQLVMRSAGFDSITSLMEEAIARRLIER
jgi:gamma-glutamylcyclotransferase (GGCT)/AIG2-like uncharacterized protein YtfP